MAGKSTFLRQNALIVILAQMGSCVPAERAEIGVIDKLFSRVGAADDLARGRSTFMVEMVETAAILNQATARSLVILDEIGRGTATFDGLSIAWATLEHLHEVNKCRALFAHALSRAHFIGRATARDEAAHHEGDGMAGQREVPPRNRPRRRPTAATASTSRSLAGLPAAVISRAQEVLGTLEQGEQASALTRLADDLPLFSSVIATVRLTRAMCQSPARIERALSEMQPRRADAKASVGTLVPTEKLDVT